MKFILEIELGNAAVKETEELHGILDKVSKHIYWYFPSDPEECAKLSPAAILDINGNVVGSYRVDNS